MGMAVHQYVIQRRVEFAKTLLLREEMSVAEVALEAGFAHQSHLARHMRRALGLAAAAAQAPSCGRYGLSLNFHPPFVLKRVGTGAQTSVAGSSCLHETQRICHDYVGTC